MEKAMSIEERIRRAEDIYNRRYGNGYYSSYKSNIKNKNKPSLSKRFIKQIIICMLVYSIFYVTSNREYFLSNEFRNKVEEFSSQNEVLKNTYNYIIGYVDKYLNKKQEENKEDGKGDNKEENKEEAEEENKASQEIQSNEVINDNSQIVNEQNIGGSNEIAKEETPKTQEEIDAEEIKNKISFVVPIEGTISSTFGWRNPTTATVPKYHTGLDLAAPTGTVIKSATDGVVTMVSSYGDYGKHYRIQNDDVTIIYAHCSKLYLKEGDYVTQGQEIAEVGSTGNSTGPHLHFEIRKEDRLVDPQLILDI